MSRARTGDNYARVFRHNYATTVLQPEAAAVLAPAKDRRFLPATLQSLFCAIRFYQSGAVWEPPSVYQFLYS